MFELEILPSCKESIGKKCKKDKELEKALSNKIQQILEDPFRFKPLRAPLQGKRRVHLMKSFVLVYSVKEKTVILEAFGHHDNAYG